MAGKSCEKSIEVEIPSDVGQSAFDKAAKKVQKRVTLKGFRRGKVPIDIVKSRFKNEILKVMLQDLLPEVAREEIEKQGILAIDSPIIEDVDIKDDLSIKVKIKVYLWPKIKLANYKKLKVKQEKVEVTQEDIKQALIPYQRALLDPEKQKDENIKPEDLPALTDEAVKKWGFESVEKLKQELEKKLYENRLSQARNKVDKQIREFLLKNSKLDVPDAWVQRQFEQKLRSFASTLAQMGMKPQQIEQILQQRKDDIYKSAEEDVKVFFIIEEIGRKESIEASDEEIEARLEKMAQRYGVDKEKMREYIDRRTGWDNFCLDIDHEKVWNYLVDIATGKQK